MMNVEGNLWTFVGSSAGDDVRALVITTNCSVRMDQGLPINPMGGGCAREAADRYKALPHMYGMHIVRNGLDVAAFYPGSLTALDDLWRQPWWIVCMPTKRRIEDPSDWPTIKRAAKQMMDLADMLGWEEIIVPRPGSGLGGLRYDRDVEPGLHYLWDDRFKVITFPKETDPSARATRTAS